MTRAHGELIVQSRGVRLALGKFRCSRTGLTVVGSPTYEEWIACGQTLAQIEGAVQWWIGDWINYGASRKDWGQKYDEAIAATGLDDGTLRNYAFVARNIQLSRRRDNLSYSAHSEIANVATAREQVRWLDRAAIGDGTKTDPHPWSVGRLRAEIRRTRLATRTPSAVPGVFDVLCADPPWAYDNSGFDQSAAAQYPTLEVDAIAALPTTDPTFPKAAPASVLFCWATSPLLPAAITVMTAWGFDYKASMVWQKDAAPGIGWWVRTRHELLLIAGRGSLHPVITPDSVIAASVGRHSEKPATFYDTIAAMYPQFRRVELFARVKRPGWFAWGNEITDESTADC